MCREGGSRDGGRKEISKQPRNQARKEGRKEIGREGREG